jgi:hypothetical protein
LAAARTPPTTAAGVASATPGAPAPTDAPLEAPVTILPLDGPIAGADAEVSGLDWHGDDLVFLPQYPGWLEGHREASGRLFAVSRQSVAAALEDASRAPITPREVPFEAGDLAERVPGFEGFEAIAFSGDTAYLAIEAQTEDEGMAAYVVSGAVHGDLAKVVVDPTSLIRLDVPPGLDNMAVESLVATGDGLLAIGEANGAVANPAPVAFRLGLDLSRQGTVDWPTIEYRLTDATAADRAGRIWLANFYWDGQKDVLQPAEDAIAGRFGEGPTHAASDTVERLVAVEYESGRAVLADVPPVQLELFGDLAPRNWEGAVRMGDEGFLLVTDTRPVTVFAFVPLPGS